MNNYSLIAYTCLLIIGFSATASGEDEKQTATVLRKLPTHKNISEEREKHKKTKKEDSKKVSRKPIVSIKPRSLIASSTLLSSAGTWTLVPKGAVVYLPAHLKNRVVSKPTGKLISWKQFFIKNAGWIHVHPIKMSEAQGKVPLKPEVVKAYKSMGKAVVATCAGGPISVSPDALKPKKKDNK